MDILGKSPPEQNYASFIFCQFGIHSTIHFFFQAEQSQSSILEKALATEKDNFHRLKVTLDTERIRYSTLNLKLGNLSNESCVIPFRSREAIDRDNETILDLRTALEVGIESGFTNFIFIFPQESTSKTQSKGITEGGCLYQCFLFLYIISRISRLKM